MEAEFGELPVLETKRLRLRKLTLKDAGDVFAYASDPEVIRYLIWSPHKSIEDSRNFIESCLELYRLECPAPWGIESKSEKNIIGTCDYIHWLPEHSRAEIGYALSRRFWGRGLMTEAVRTIITYGFKIKKVNRIQAMCEVANIGSARVMEKIGMIYEGILRQYMIQNNAFRDMKIYAMLRNDWKD